MKNDLRCLNLSNSAAVAVYEVLRQNSYPDMI
jgi:tRNA(Leu) C34 or U34 (ribose-2'-O)-methylase TrmL